MDIAGSYHISDYDYSVFDDANTITITSSTRGSQCAEPPIKCRTGAVDYGANTVIDPTADLNGSPFGRRANPRLY